MIKFSFTYDVISPESAKNGDYEDSGYILPGHWQYSMNDETIRQDILDNRNDYALSFPEFRLYDVITFAQSLGIIQDSGNWLSSIDPDMNCQNGEETFYNMHMEGITAATYNRIKRLLNAK